MNIIVYEESVLKGILKITSGSSKVDVSLCLKRSHPYVEDIEQSKEYH